MKKVKYFLLMALFLMMPAQKVHAQLNFGSVFSAVKKAMKEQKAMKEKNSTLEQSQPVVNGDAASSASGSGQSTSVLPAKTSNDEVTLVVSADGATKDEATKTALRSAIEQAYGTFVSANTTILNDELVKDEIVTITSGNIKNYYEIASATMPNGKQTVTLKATVCVSKLVSYAQSKGASTEFAGAAFGMNIKMKELNKKNEAEALSDLLTQIKSLVPYVFERSLDVGTPKVGQNGNYKVEMKLVFKTNENFINMRKLVFSTLNSISLTKDEAQEYKELEIPTVRLRIVMKSSDEPQCILKAGTEMVCHLRSDEQTICTFLRQLYYCFASECRDYKILDNNGKVYRTGDLNKYEYLNNANERNVCSFWSRINDAIMAASNRFTIYGSENKENFVIDISNEDMMKISNFTIERK